MYICIHLLEFVRIYSNIEYFVQISYLRRKYLIGLLISCLMDRYGSLDEPSIFHGGHEIKLEKRGTLFSKVFDFLKGNCELFKIIGAVRRTGVTPWHQPQHQLRPI